MGNLNQEQKNLLVKMAKTISVSGYEQEMINLFMQEAERFSDHTRVDVIGNVYATINSESKCHISVMLCAHIDEIGFLVTKIDEKGFIEFAPVGGWDGSIVPGQRVIIRGNFGYTKGVVATLPVHLQNKDDNKKVKISNMRIDVGGDTTKITIGDPIVIDCNFEDIGEHRFVSRGLDDKIGAFVIMEAGRRLSSFNNIHKPKIDIVGTVQEELGRRGAEVASNFLQPTVGIAVDVEHALDYSEAPKTSRSIELGKGVVISRGANIHPKLFELFKQTAIENNIPFQIIASPADSGTDANKIQLSNNGVITGLLSIPNRYMHTPCEMCDWRDVESAIDLIVQTILKIDVSTDFSFI